jgi:hypothetical protein
LTGYVAESVYLRSKAPDQSVAVNDKWLTVRLIAPTDTNRTRAIIGSSDYPARVDRNRMIR